MKIKILSLFAWLLLLSSCNNDYFDPMSNFPGDDLVVLDMDLQGVVNEGIVLPSKNQCDEAAFVFKFKAKEGQYYKIFYQNESYKFDSDDPLNNENFYGSWEDVSVGFKMVKDSGIQTDTFRIVGNPRDEKKYYGADHTKNSFNQKAIDKVIQDIHNIPEWLESVKQKAINNGNDLEKQLYLDALWMINDAKNRGNTNNRFKRNPRVGTYSFILVLCDENGLNELPDYIKDISKTDENGQFVNPYYYFAENISDNIRVIKSPRKLKTRAVISPEYGIFLNESKMKTNTYTIDTSSYNMGNGEDYYSNALYSQFLSSISRQYTLRNIPLIKDVVSDDDPYTMEEYWANEAKYDSSQLCYDHPYVSDCLGSTLRYNEEDNSITLINPGNNDPNDLKKESTGIISRVGFTYGKYRGKIKFPQMLNEDNIWNGLTYAFWLIFQDNNAWNNRRTSTAGGGYIDKADDSKNPVRHTDYYYSEIDIEIVKASKFWPKSYYKDDTEFKSENPMYNNEVMYCCTNWDLATREPEKFSSGINEIVHQGKRYEAMRWDDLYKAITIKSPISNDIFKEDYYYYEIEWRPKEIIWRLGSSPDDMRVVGYMNDKCTSIPNNQMLCIITQEYHYSEWWPPIVFKQGLIPYNKSDIEGKVYEIVIE